ncbi:ORF2 [Torque teno mini virus 8]|uniref:ORF2 n=1 Tax=Torque teno mini virus 8 TaxID=687376 RepID=Q91C94_9VIRU|nr:ORF2 [Torque teno mini virus 8]AAL11041.1 ORF2 [Torque teno mini virus 8]
MSTRYIPTKDSHRQKNLKWLNFVTHAHDIFCDCDSPLQHTVANILIQEPNIKFNTQEKDLLKKCLGETTTTEGAGDPEGFGDGDLERLFTEDFGEEDTG